MVQVVGILVALGASVPSHGLGNPQSVLLEGLLSAPEASQGNEEGVAPGSVWIVVAMLLLGVEEKRRMPLLLNFEVPESVPTPIAIIPELLAWLASSPNQFGEVVANQAPQIRYKPYYSA